MVLITVERVWLVSFLIMNYDVTLNLHINRNDVTVSVSCNGSFSVETIVETIR